MAKTNSQNPNSRLVTIFRAGSHLSRAQGAEVDDLFMDSKQGIGSYFDSVNSQKVASGLDFKEEALLLPLIIDVPADDREFRKKLTDFYADINTNVPFGKGVTLETGLTESNEKDVSKDNLPIKLIDYLRWRHAQGHPWVAASKEQSSGDQTYQFYMFDPASIQGKNTKKLKEQDAAMQIYLKIKHEPETIDQMLTLLGIEPRAFIGKNKDDLKVEALREKLMSEPEKFTQIYTQGDLDIKYWIQTMVATGVLKEIGGRFINAETDKLEASNLEEMVWFFKDEANSDKVTVLKARMQEALAQMPALTKRKTVVPAGSGR